MKFKKILVPLLLIIIIINIFITIVIAGGTAFFKTLGKNLPVTLSLLGSKERINEGIPIVETLAKVNWIGMKG